MLWCTVHRHVAIPNNFLWPCCIVCGVGGGYPVLVLLAPREFLSRHQPAPGTHGVWRVSGQFFRGQYGLDRVSATAVDVLGPTVSVCLGGGYLGRSGRHWCHFWSVYAVLQSVPGLGSVNCVWSGHCCGADSVGGAVDFEHCRPSRLQKETSPKGGPAGTDVRGGRNPAHRVQVQAADFYKSR